MIFVNQPGEAVLGKKVSQSKTESPALEARLSRLGGDIEPPIGHCPHPSNLDPITCILKESRMMSTGNPKSVTYKKLPVSLRQQKLGSHVVQPYH